MIPVHGLLRQGDHECLANLVQKKLKNPTQKKTIEVSALFSSSEVHSL